MEDGTMVNGMKTPVRDDKDFIDLRNETSVSSASYSDGSFVGLFYTTKWGDFNKACQRITKFKPIEYRKRTDEPEIEYAKRIKALEKYLNNNYSKKATFILSYNNYRIQVYDSQYLDAIYAIRSEYKPRPKKSKFDSKEK